MRYLVRAYVKPGQEEALLEAIEGRTLGRGSIAYPTYIRCMEAARLSEEGQVRWIEACYCLEAFGPGGELAEELPYWEEYFEKIDIRHARRLSECEGYPKCGDCDCTVKLEAKLGGWGGPFLESLKSLVTAAR